ncbi:hypothetical protein LA66_07070 [Aureimonas altamirensis]|uniref:Uncharacterized protein n=1 Tax=Aureimonas altamirensis TaxID=370622 RepID=A0A0B1Q7C8_9HYPH|nr:hypothetical protein [Aureimonas altamirensis]KHJ56309.1 hypothetical protein LA66_07070 [Aureimonas altamirensis]
MEYIAPAGQLPGSPYIDGDRSAGIKGSVVPAAAIEHAMREIVHVIDFAGLAPDRTDLEQLRKAIEAIIASQTGGGDTAQYLLLAQASSRLPIFPEILSADGRINVTSPSAGTVLVPATVPFQHRGIAPYSTSTYTEAQRTFATTGGKTYHLRWTPTGGFALRDLANSGYNPDLVSEDSVRFDTTYDDMLVARVVTNASNIATVTNLVNKARIETEATSTGPAEIYTYGTGRDGARYTNSFAINWGRRPSIAVVTGDCIQSGHPLLQGGANQIRNKVTSRYSVTATVISDWDRDLVVAAIQTVAVLYLHALAA